MDPTNLFDTSFTVTAIDPDGKKFDRVSRIIAHSSGHDMNLSLDVATDIYPISVNQTLSFQLAASLQRTATAAGRTTGGTVDADAEMEGAGAGASVQEREPWRMDAGNAGIADDFDYVMYGKVYKYDEGHSEIVTVYASFGGLLMALTGHYRHLSNVSIGANVYLLLR
ncbi:DNA-directed RNA polymerases I, II, and III subunit RPABC3 [Tilletia horrida]|nr:DNA-directed RNA polymerases I, II, and III subunit RPABC3 [Tilletia horrida]